MQIEGESVFKDVVTHPNPLPEAEEDPLLDERLVHQRHEEALPPSILRVRRNLLDLLEAAICRHAFSLPLQLLLVKLVVDHPVVHGRGVQVLVLFQLGRTPQINQTLDLEVVDDASRLKGAIDGRKKEG